MLFPNHTQYRSDEINSTCIKINSVYLRTFAEAANRHGNDGSSVGIRGFLIVQRAQPQLHLAGWTWDKCQHERTARFRFDFPTHFPLSLSPSWFHFRSVSLFHSAVHTSFCFAVENNTRTHRINSRFTWKQNGIASSECDRRSNLTEQEIYLFHHTDTTEHGVRLTLVDLTGAVSHRQMRSI